MRPVARLAGAVLALAAATSWPVWAAEQDATAVLAGQRIYRDGVLADGSALRGTRSDGVRVSGASAACITCHRASGMGGAEGNQFIPPVVGAVLRAVGQGAPERSARTPAGMARSQHPALTRVGFTDSSFAQIMAQGQRPTGEALGYLMPRYALDATALAQLRAYLDTLQVGQAPGVSADALHLATIVTADAPAPAREATVDIISRCVAERSPKASGRAESLRPWQHHVWQLGADPARWQEELAEHQRRQPVFAAISGVSGGAWTPIHQFCERSGMPCVLPNTAAVDDTQASRWSFYFSRGVSLEAATLAQRLADQAPAGGWGRIVQRVDESEAAQLGAQALSRRLRELGVTADIEQQGHQLEADRTLAANLAQRDLLVLWLNPAALQSFTENALPPTAGQVAVSGELGGLDAAPISAAWRPRTQLLYAYEPEPRRTSRILLNAGHWMARQSLVLTPELSRLQGNTYSACEITVRALQVMRERYSRAYFTELVEGSDEAAIATAYPRFTLGPEQRYGSKGSFIMRYAAPGFAQLAPAGDWIVPP
jgi:hypothetical protein